MNPHLGLRLPRLRHRNRADRVIEREYAAAQDTVLRVTAAKLGQIGIVLDPGDLDAAYNQAWHALYLRLAEGAEIENRTGFLVTTAYRRAIDEHRASRSDRHVELPEDVRSPDDDLAQRLDDRHRLRALRAGMRERLDARELRAATLCYLHGHTRREAADALGISPRRMEKVMDRVSKRMSELAADVQEDWCEQQRSLIQAYALGVLDPDGERYPLAVAHLEDCSACRRRVLVLRGLAAVAPPVPLLLAGGTAVGGLAGSPRERSEADGLTHAATEGGRSGATLTVVGGTAAAAAVGVTIGVVLLVGGGDEQPVAVPPVTTPASTVSTPSGRSAADREREQAAARDRAARQRAARRRAERARERRATTAAATATATTSTAAAPAPAQAAPPASGPSSGASGGATGPAPDPRPAPSSGSAPDAGSTSSGSAGTGVVTDGAEEFDLGD